MALRPDTNTSDALQLIRVVAATVAVGDVVKDGANDHECQPAGVGEAGYGVVTAIGGNTSVIPGAVGDKATVAMLAGPVILPVKVGTGGVTRGARLKSVANGLTDATPVGAAGTLIAVHGIATQTGVVGDLVGMLVAPSFVTEA